MRYLVERNPKLDPRYRDIAALLQAARRGARHPLGLCLLPDGAGDQQPACSRGDVRATQAEQLRRPRRHRRRRAGRQLPGRLDRRAGADAAPGRLLRASGSQAPVAPRTREKQDDIIELSLALRRPVRFSDLTNRWAADRNYAQSMNVAGRALSRRPTARPAASRAAGRAQAAASRDAHRAWRADGRCRPKRRPRRSRRGRRGHAGLRHLAGQLWRHGTRC